MGEQIKRHYLDEETGSLRGSPTRHGWHLELVAAKDHDREIAQRDARIGELNDQLAAAKELVVDVHNSRELIRAERDTAREMLREANAHIARLAIERDELMRLKGVMP